MFPDLARKIRAALSTPSPASGEALAYVLKFIDDYFAPWGSWKTAWWEDAVSEDAAFNAENALKHVANKLRAFAPKPDEATEDLGHKIRSPDQLAPADAWQELVEYDDRTTPAEYPDMALITADELASFMERATSVTFQWPKYDKDIKDAFDAYTKEVSKGLGHGNLGFTITERTPATFLWYEAWERVGQAIAARGEKKS